MNRRSLWLSQIHHSALALFSVLVMVVGCAPTTQRHGRPIVPIRGQSGAVSAEVLWVSIHDAGVQVGVSVKAPAGAKLLRAALAQPRLAQEWCRPTDNACDPLDARFTTAPSATMLGKLPDVLLWFPSYGGRRELEGKPQLLLDLNVEGRRTEVELALAPRQRSYESSEWGLGGAARYRLRGTAHPRIGDTFTLGLGAERWLGATRLHLGYEIGLAYCRGRDSAEAAECDEDGVQVPVVGHLTGLRYFRLDDRLTLGLGLGYMGLWLLGQKQGSTLPALLHGPRLAFQLVQTAPDVKYVSDGRPKLAQSPELSLELLFQDRFTEPHLAPGIAWSYWGTF